MDRRFVPEPIFRKLRVFAMDPGATAHFDTAVINEMTVRLTWEELEPGPVGASIAVVDEDETGKQLHPPIDLDRPELLAQNGLPASDGNPQFRQQMVYAVAMKTVRNFEQALGRPVQWPGGESQLRIYPHYMEIENAFYQANRGLCLGYFRTTDSALPGTVVFTSLSQDVIAHELTHALLNGMGLTVDVARDSDEYALHEAFADLVALFQHFGESNVLRKQIGEVRGDLHKRSLLGAVAPQFGAALGKPEGIRNALGFTDEAGKWHRRVPNPELLQTLTEPHERGDVLVAAVFGAFTKIYESRIADLRRIATKGSGILPEGELHPDLIARLAFEASESARHVLRMCIRALDYMPPGNLSFGDYLRAIITADHDLVPSDALQYRVAFLDSFRRHGIVPAGVGTLSVDTLLWTRPGRAVAVVAVEDFFARLSERTNYWSLPSSADELRRKLDGWCKALGDHLRQTDRAPRLGPIDLKRDFVVESLALRRDSRLAGDLLLQWVVKVVQDSKGCTLLVDADSGRVRYLIEQAPTTGRRRAAKGSTTLLASAGATRMPLPSERCLRVFTFDPSLGVEVATAGINEVTLRVPWEQNAEGRDTLQPGPVGEYLEVVDRDPASGCFYAPVDLNDVRIVAQDGLAPSESNPQFHQQMVYAVTMRVIRDFENALGRLALWSPRRYRATENGGEGWREDYVQRLRVYPHALREANAYYSPSKKALLFGYFPAGAEESSAGAGKVTVFTCLSHDIVAHEVTHALLDGIHRRFNEPSNPDVLAFHEAFADIVALFEHFSVAEVLRHQIAATRGDLTSQNRLGELAQQFGRAIGMRGALRSAIGQVNPSTGAWERITPDPDAYRRELEPHARGAILVAAVFDAFLTIYKSRVGDLLRIATEGTGVLPEGNLHPDLVNRLSDEAATAAQRVLHMCIRALDYCPPVDITFGDYVRAIVTADFEHDPIDDEHRRVAFVEAFRRYGIVPEDVRTLSVDGLLWRPSSAAPDEDEDVVIDLVKQWAVDIAAWNLSRDRRLLFEKLRGQRAGLHEYLKQRGEKGSAVLSGIDPKLPFEVHSIRPSMRTDWGGQPRLQWAVDVTQRIAQYFSAESERSRRPDWYFRGGCTLLVDAQTGKVRYSIKKRLDEAVRLERQRRYVTEEGNESLAATYLGGMTSEHDEAVRREPFAMLHRFSGSL